MKWVKGYNVNMSIEGKMMRDRRRQLRRSATGAEEVMWKELRQLRNLGYKFRRQHSIGWYIVDFYCPSANLIIEIDGPIHDVQENIEYDKERDHWLNSQKYKILRFTNEQVMTDLNGVIKIILQVFL